MTYFLNLESKKYNSKTYSYFFRFYLKVIYGLKINNLLCSLDIVNVFLQDIAEHNSKIDDGFFYVVVDSTPQQIVHIVNQLKRHDILAKEYTTEGPDKTYTVLKLKFFSNSTSFTNFLNSEYSKMFTPTPELIEACYKRGVVVINPDTNQPIKDVHEALELGIEDYYFSQVLEKEFLYTFKLESALEELSNSLGYEPGSFEYAVISQSEYISKLKLNEEIFNSKNFVDSRYLTLA